MSTLLEQFRKSQGLLGAVEAITNRRAFITLFATFAVSGLLFAGVSTAVASLLYEHVDTAKVLGFIGALATFALILLGISATGFLLNDVVRGREQKTITQALMLAVATFHRILGVLLIVALVGISVIVVASVAIFLCKLPGLGPLLYVVVFPACAVLLGITLYAGLFVVALHGPAVWDGYEVLRIVAMLGAIIRERLFSVIIQTILLTLLVALVASLIFACIGAGSSLTGAMSFRVLGQELGSMNPMFLLSGLMGSGGDGAAYVKAGLFGAALLGGMAITAPCLVVLAGNCIIWANVSENLSTEVIDQKLKEAMDAARAGAEQARRQLEEARSQMSNQAAPVASNAAQCPHCLTPAAPGDVFCGNCGKRIA